ncbi:iron-sulfur cluster assembly accessory protein [bacterium (Candidatus Blackallbacteria) CG17_big_fil_post_rev_8_21_14_2_50_48_46]|uniref:Iron-sulfur cluster assembly accessory protein n=1 Tax=bacterium (Candidatus Blackallbacteria) CG17_big_fil_post_rev_8_21_14_2_50_48_46 TaxID=2014261 RepID=A0A2M7G6E3_9BACT|nr:MAG: iron-sulfur cluster assembly accessory protein [bacterium (Candidatus Blackallbacteria) CG18_big_fil_WC_8_21_14_2_50_49_26]PIW17607.1 MAG: iron-sulfur cluster assembly accessory protein [bacterium (Candidatus Blackallbacteria) CG17_big_fil_post_rev_8_21_14_2_50_48_46]PIW48462.1 MAG: iron-sulfur cluster assembly accessory protein [bacterium (Candidatus Blackallbacteria) CG13_big_fil_rev_8_21_14_2_50_49_14]
MPPLVQVTPKALTEIQRFLSRQDNAQLGIRLAVKGGGCSGLSYHLDYDEPKERDHILEQAGIKVLIDRKSAIYLKGMTLDFNDGLNGRGFKFINPNASNTCGCGESFSV